MDEVLAGDGLSLSELAKKFPNFRGPGRMDPSACYRWTQTGCKSSDGRMVRLEAVRVGSRLLTSNAAVRRFIANLSNPAAASAPPSPTPRPAAGNRKQRAAKATRRLEKMGA